MIAERIPSLKNVSEEVLNGESFKYVLRDFLEGFYTEPSWEKIRDEPRLLKSVLKDDGLADAYLAAVCEHLSVMFRLKKADWVNGTQRRLKRPHFSAKSHGLRMLCLQESPTAFRKRNLFVGANCLEPKKSIEE